MRFNFMRLVLFFDLPVDTRKQRHDYRMFVKNLKQIGFYMFQESVYVKLNINQKSTNSIIDKVNKFTPKDGLVSILTITEKQFCEIKNLAGQSFTDVLNSEEREIFI